MYRNGDRGQFNLDHMYDASGSTASNTTPLLILPQRTSTAWMTIQNVSNAVLWIEFGSARATCTISGGVVNGTTITNAGFGFTYPPDVTFLGGGAAGNTTRLAVGLPGYPAPGGGGTWNAPGDPPNYRPAKGHALLTTGAVSSIVIDDGGAGYATAPFVLLTNSFLDPFGCADPSVNSGSGIRLAANGGALTIDGNFMTTDPIAVFGASMGLAFTVKWAP